MRTIYSMAARTVLGLGDPPIENDALVLRHFFNTLNPPESLGAWESEDEERDFYEYIEKQLSIPEIHDPLQRLWENRYFRRIWCVQEVQLASHVLLYYGTEILEWHKVKAIVDAVDYLEDMEHVLHTASIRPSTDGYVEHMAKSVKEPLDSLLMNYIRFEATNPRDKVYGLLGLVNPSQDADLIEVDYDKPVSQVYAEAVLAAWTTSSYCGILSNVYHEEDYDGNDGFKSWVPRWDCDHEHYRATATWPFQGTDDWLPSRSLGSATSEGNICIHGLVFDTTVSIEEPFRYEDLGHATNRDPTASTKAIVTLWDKVIGSKIPTSFKDQRIQALARTLVLNDFFDYSINRPPNYIPWGPGNETHVHLVVYFLAYLHCILKSMSHPGESTYQHLWAEYIEFGVNIEGMLETDDGKRWGSSVSPDSDTKGPLADWRDYDIVGSLAQMCRNRRLFWITKGLYGLGPSCIREGDFIVVLYGVKYYGTTCVPYAMRPKDNGGYLFLGEVYIDDLMIGKFKEDMEARNFEERWFRLI